MKADEVRALRGEHMSMIFQQPTSALNPVFRAGAQIKEVFELHRDWSAEVEEEKVIEMLTKVGIPDPKRRAEAYPHELSGGMAQRIMIAMALACEPELLIADEPTTALDVTIQAQILDLIRDLQKTSNTSVILITHDLGIVAEMADRVSVMYAGRDRRGDRCPLDLQEPAPPIYQGVDRFHSGAGIAPGPTRCDPRCCALDDRPPQGLSIRSEVHPTSRECLADLHRDRARPTGSGGGPQGSLLAVLRAGEGRRPRWLRRWSRFATWSRSSPCVGASCNVRWPRSGP